MDTETNEMHLYIISHVKSICGWKFSVLNYRQGNVKGDVWRRGIESRAATPVYDTA